MESAPRRLAGVRARLVAQRAITSRGNVDRDHLPSHADQRVGSCPVRFARLPLTYDECRARFRRAATAAGVAVESHAIAARVPMARSSPSMLRRSAPRQPRRALLILSGVHGVEGFVGSALQCDSIGRLDPATPPE